MPVPVKVSHPKSVGLAAQFATEAVTEGPWARLGVGTSSQQTEDHRTAQSAAAAGATATATASDAEAPAAAAAAAGDEASVATCHLTFCYPGIDGQPLPDRPPVVRDMSISLPRGATCLLIGPNGAGKTTLLKVLGGKHMVPQAAVRVLGQPPFHATHLTTSGTLSYIGGNWERDIAFAGYSIPLAGDIPASQMLASLPGIDPARRDQLIEVLDIDPTWRMHLVSDGQRRRVQIAMGLLKPFQVLLLDEITVDLDVLGRADLMAFLRQECAERGATVIYATHIFDGLESWPSHLVYVAGGQLRAFGPASQFPELQQGRLLELVERWLREEARTQQAARQAQLERRKAGRGEEAHEGLRLAAWNNGYAAGRLASSVASPRAAGGQRGQHGLSHSSNAVMRM